MWLSTLSLFMICGFAHGQFKVVDDNSARIVILNGGRVDFSFNSITKWQSGITYNNFTTLGIEFTDLVGPVTSWELMFKANDPPPLGFMSGDNGNLLELNKIEVRAENALNLGNACFPVIGFKVLTAADQIIARGNVFGFDCGTIAIPCLSTGVTPRLLFIDWRFGVTNTVLGEAPDHYAEDIIFTLQPNTGIQVCP